MRKYSLLLVIIFSFLLSSLSFADSCPYCGMSYGDPAPGDESRVYALRADHEASCSSNPANSSSGGDYSYSSGSSSGWTYQDQRRYEEDERRIAEQAELERKRVEEEKRKKRLANEAEEDEITEAELAHRFEVEKDDLRDALKGKSGEELTMKSSDTSRGSGELEIKDYKTEIKRQEDYYKSIKVEKVPSPVVTYGGDQRRVISDEETRLEKIRKEWDKINIYEKMKYYGSIAINKINETKKNIVEWCKSRSLDETFNRIPFAGELKSIGEKAKGLYTSMKDLAVGIFSGTSSKLNEGIKDLGSDRIQRGSDDDRYSDKIGEDAKRKAGEMASDEVKGKGSF